MLGWGKASGRRLLIRPVNGHHSVLDALATGEDECFGRKLAPEGFFSGKSW